MKEIIDFIRERRVDPRILQIMAIGSYAIIARELSAFERPHHWTLIIIVYGVCLDLLLGKFLFKKVNVPYTPIIAAIASSMLIDSPYIWVYMVSVTVAIGAKAFLTVNGRHLLNPANSGVTFCLLAFPGMMTGLPKLFNFNAPTIGVFFLIGSFVAIYARVFQTAACWLISFALFAFIGRG